MDILEIMIVKITRNYKDLIEQHKQLIGLLSQLMREL